MEQDDFVGDKIGTTPAAERAFSPEFVQGEYTGPEMDGFTRVSSPNNGAMTTVYTSLRNKVSSIYSPDVDWY